MHRHTETTPRRPAWNKPLIPIVMAAMLGGGIGLVTARTEPQPEPVSAPAVAIQQPSFADLVAAVKPAVVNISAEGRSGAQQQTVMPDLDALPPMLRRFFEDFGSRRSEPGPTRSAAAMGAGQRASRRSTRVDSRPTA